MDDHSKDKTEYVTPRYTLSPMESFARAVEDEISKIRSSGASIATSLGAEKCGSYPPKSWTTPRYSTERLIEDIHQMVCNTLAPRDAVGKLTELIDEASCPVDDCKKCKYFNPGSIDYCRTGEKIAEFLINTGLVKVMCHKPIDKSKET